MALMTPQQLEQYVLMAADAAHLEYQQEANRVLNHWVSSHSDVELADIILEVVRLGSRHEVVLFYVLTVYTRLDEATPHQRAQFREEILSESMMTRMATGSSGENGGTWSPTYLRTKVGVLLSHFIQLDFPHDWRAAFDDLTSPQVLERAPDILLRTLVALMEEFGRDETDGNRSIKNFMRGYTSPHEPEEMIIHNPLDTISGRLVPPVLTLLDQALALDTGYSNGRREQQQREKLQISVLCLNVLKGFMSWVDVMLVLDDKVLQLIYGALARGGGVTDDASVFADAGVAAVECMQELIARGMEDEKKISMLLRTNVLEKIHSIVDLVTVDASPIDVVLVVAQFINRTGLEILPALQKTEHLTPSLQTESATLEAQLLDLFFRCFAFDDIDVSGAVIPLAGSLVSDTGNNVDPSSTLLPQLLTIAYQQMRYPPDFQYDFEDDDEAEEELYRTELRKLNKKFVRASPDVCLQFLCQVLSQLPLPLSTAPTPDLEAAISLIYQYCEGIRPPPGMTAVMQNRTFCSLLVGLHTSDVTYHSHREVLLLYYETSVRYYPLLSSRPELLQTVLEAMTGDRGLQHAHSKVRSRCCYLLLRLVKSLGTNNVHKPLRPYVETAVSGIQGLLEANNEGGSNGILRQDDTSFLFETIGLLLGKNGLNPTEQQSYLTRVMTPHTHSIESLLKDQRPAILQDPDTYGEKLSASIAAIAFLSKGFKRPAAEVQAVLMETLHISLAVFEVLPGSDTVRNKTFILVQRLIQCLDEKVLPIMPRFLHLLVSHCTADDILDVSQLMNQLCIKFKADAVGSLDGNLLPFLQKCHRLSTMVVSQQPLTSQQEEIMNAPHLRTEQLSIQKLSYAVLQHIVTHGATAVFLTQMNAPSLETILQSMGEGAIRVEDPLIKKTCLAFFRDLVDQWTTSGGDSNKNSIVAPPPEFVVQGFLRFLCDVLIPGMMIFYLSTSFDINDANQFRGFSEFCGILEVFHSRHPVLFYQQVLVITLRIQFSVPLATIETFRASRGRKDFEVNLKALLQAKREKKR